MRFQNTTQNCESQKVILEMRPHPSCPRHLSLLRSPCEPRCDRTLARDHRLFDRQPPSRSKCSTVRSKDSQRTSSPLPLWCFTQLATNREQGGSRWCRYLEESKLASGVPTFVPDHRADQPWEVGMYALLGQMNFGGITSSLSNSARSLSVPFWAIA